MTNKICPSCGAQVSPNERFCANCGSRMDDLSSAATQTLPQVDETSPTPPTQAPLPPAPPPQFQIPGDIPPAEPPKRGVNRVWIFVLLGVAGLCFIIFATTIAALFMFNQNRDQDVVIVAATTVIAATVPQPVSTAVPTVSAVDPTATAKPTNQGAQGVQGMQQTLQAAQAGAADRATAEAGNATATIGPTQAAQATAYANADAMFARAREIFSDDFTDNRNQWFTGRFNDIETDVIEDGVFKVLWDADGTSYEVYGVRSFRNVIAEVDCAIVRGGVDGSCSLVFAQNDDVGYYEFEVFNDYYRLYVFSDAADPLIIAEGDLTSTVLLNDPNRLRVIHVDAEIGLYLNGEWLASVSDSTFTEGKVGVATSCYREEGEVEIWFDNLTIWELPEEV